MRPLIYFVASSLDGFIAGPRDEIDWLFLGDDYGFNAFFKTVDSIVTGRRTWEISQSWQNDILKTKEVAVFSRAGSKLFKPSGQTLEIADDPVSFTRNLLQEIGGPV